MRKSLYILSVIILLWANATFCSGVVLYDQFNNGTIESFWKADNATIYETTTLFSGVTIWVWQVVSVTSEVPIVGDFTVTSKATAIQDRAAGDGGVNEEAFVDVILEHGTHNYKIHHGKYYYVAGSYPNFNPTFSLYTDFYRDGNLLIRIPSEQKWGKFESRNGTIRMYYSDTYNPTNESGTWTLATTESQDSNHRNFSQVKIEGLATFYVESGHGVSLSWTAEYIKINNGSGGNSVKYLF